MVAGNAIGVPCSSIPVPIPERKAYQGALMTHLTADCFGSVKPIRGKSPIWFHWQSRFQVADQSDSDGQRQRALKRYLNRNKNNAPARTETDAIAR